MTGIERNAGDSVEDVAAIVIALILLDALGALQQ